MVMKAIKTHCQHSYIKQNHRPLIVVSQYTHIRNITETIKKKTTIEILHCGSEQKEVLTLGQNGHESYNNNIKTHCHHSYIKQTHHTLITASQYTHTPATSLKP